MLRGKLDRLLVDRFLGRRAVPYPDQSRRWDLFLVALTDVRQGYMERATGVTHVNNGLRRGRQLRHLPSGVHLSLPPEPGSPVDHHDAVDRVFGCCDPVGDHDDPVAPAELKGL